jgi:hypothetical protein
MLPPMSRTDPSPAGGGRPEPILLGQVGTIVTAVLGLLVAFGVPLTDDQRDTVLALVGALVPVAAMLGAWWSRSRVTPLSDPRDASGRSLMPRPTPRRPMS